MGYLETNMLKIEDLCVSFTQYQKGLKRAEIEGIRNLNLTLAAGEILAVVGESGAGKSLLAHAILGILPKNARWKGDIRYQGLELTPKVLSRLRGLEIAFIPQSVNALDPLMRVEKQVCSGGRWEMSGFVGRMLEKMGLSENVARMYPHQLSGGMARRVLVASAVSKGAKLIIADEPTPGLHWEASEKILQILKESADGGAAVLLITHDIATAAKVSDHVAVLHEGRLLEVASAKAFHGPGENLKHPYTRSLWSSLPQNEFMFSSGSLENTIQGKRCDNAS